MQACLGGAAECRAALLVDLDEGMVLASSGGYAADGPETGAVMAAAVCEILGNARPAALAALDEAHDHAVIATEDALLVLQRLEAAPRRALCLSFATDAAPEAALAHARLCQQAVAKAGLW